MLKPATRICSLCLPPGVIHDGVAPGGFLRALDPEFGRALPAESARRISDSAVQCIVVQAVRCLTRCFTLHRLNSTATPMAAPCCANPRFGLRIRRAQPRHRISPRRRHPPGGGRGRNQNLQPAQLLPVCDGRFPRGAQPLRSPPQLRVARHALKCTLRTLDFAVRVKSLAVVLHMGT